MHKRDVDIPLKHLDTAYFVENWK